MTLAPFGARLVDVRMPDRDGHLDNCVLGFDDEADYVLHVDTYMGATIGRVAGRSANARFVGGGLSLTLEPNDSSHTLHSGPHGSLDRVTWSAEPVTESRGTGVCFSTVSPDGAGGYPGNLRAAATYLLNDDNEITCELRASANRATPVAMTQHAYWNLSSGGRESVLDHELWVASDQVFGMTADLVATGEMWDVTDTGFDFRLARTMRDRLPEETGVPWPGLDHTYELRASSEGKRQPVASLYSSSTGRRMDIITTEPALQVYLGCHLTNISGRDGATYGPGAGVCLETVRFPDSPLLPQLPTIVLASGDEYVHHTTYRFTTK